MSMSEKKLKQYAQFAENAIDNTYLMGKTVLGYDLLCGPHQELAEFLDKDTRANEKEKSFKMVLFPRDTFKSTMALCYGMRGIARNHDVSILIFSEERPRATAMADAMRTHFESNELFRYLYGDFVNQRNWQSDWLIVSKRKKQRQDPTITTAGVDVTRTGLHFDIILVDDIHSQKNTATTDAIQKTKRNFTLLEPMLRPGGTMIVFGTRWHYDDVYGDILKFEEKFPGSWDILVVPAYEGTLEDNPKMNFPGILSIDRLQRAQAMMSSYDFGCNYLLKPVRDEDKKFKADWFRHCKRGTLKYGGGVPEGLRYQITIDPARTRKKQSDYTAICVAGHTLAGEIYIVHMERGKWTEAQKLEKIAALTMRYHAQDVGIEVAGGTDAAELVERDLRQLVHMTICPRVHPIHTSGIPKKDRIMQLQPYYQRGQIWHIMDESWELPQGMRELEDELDEFPFNSGHDDMMDAVQMQLKMPAGKLAFNNQSPIEYKPQSRIQVLEDRRRQLEHALGQPWMMQ